MRKLFFDSAEKSLQNARRAAGLTQTAAAAKIGVSLQTIKSWENNRRSPHRKHWSKIAETYGMALSDVIEMIISDSGS